MSNDKQFSDNFFSFSLGSQQIQGKLMIDIKEFRRVRETLSPKDKAKQTRLIKKLLGLTK